MKWYGQIGYGDTIETSPGIWEQKVTVKSYSGELLRNTRRRQPSGEQLNDNITISNQISILSDPYALQNFHQMLFAEFMGTKWKIVSVNVEYPRLILDLGDVYNE